MANLAITIANEILKIDYQDVVRDVLNSAVVLQSRLERDYDSVQGDQVYIGLNTGRNKSFASRAAGADLPFRGTQTYGATFFDIPEMYGRLQVTQRDIKASRNSKGALLRILDAEMRHFIRDAKVELNRMNYGDGLGIIARLNDANPDDNATVQVHVEHQHDVTPLIGTVDTYWATRFAEPGMRLNFVDQRDPSGATERLTDTSPRPIVDSVVKGATPTITFTATLAGLAGATAIADGDFVFIEGSHGQDQMGLLGLIDDGSDANRRFLTSLQGIDRSVAANDFWNSTVLKNAGVLRDITLRLLQDGNDEAEAQGDGEVTCWITTYGIRSDILALMIADKRFTAPFEMDLDGGFRSLSYNGVPIVPDRHAPKHMLFGLDEPTLKYYQMSDLEWLEEDGSVLNRIPDKASYEATGFLYRELANTDPKNSVRIEDLNDSTNL